MSEDTNDSPAFRLRPRRAAPKSYYTVRLEYSANPAAFIRERPRSSNKRKVLTQKSASISTKTASSASTITSINPRLHIVTKEEREREERRIALHRDISESITTNTSISPFIQRLRLEELEPRSVYEHNYVTLKVKKVIPSVNGRLLHCHCHDTDNSPPKYSVTVRLHDDYANSDLVLTNKYISIAKFRTGADSVAETDPTESSDSDTNQVPASPQGPISPTLPDSGLPARHSGNASPLDAHERQSPPSNSSSSSLGGQLSSLAFDVIVKNDELVVRSTSNSNRSSTSPSLSAAASSSSGGASVNRRPMVPFVSISDTLEQPTEPYVEMSPPSPVHGLSSGNQRGNGSSNNNNNSHRAHQDDENQECKKVKFTANVPV